jgi:hypothetical protein
MESGNLAKVFVMDDLDLEFGKDAGDRLVAMNPGRPWFDRAARLAGEQLEWLMPATMGAARRGGLYAGTVVIGAPGTVVFVCSNETKLCTIHLPGKATSVLDQIADAVQQHHPEVNFTVPFAAGAMRMFINKFGAKPGKAHPKYPNGFGHDLAINIIGSLWNVLGASGKSDTGNEIDACIAAGVCPAIVCLIGRSQSGAKNGYSFCLLMLPMAPYADHVLAAA